MDDMRGELTKNNPDVDSAKSDSAKRHEHYLVSSEQLFGELALAASRLDGYVVEEISLGQLRRHIPDAYDKEGRVPTMILVYPEGSKSGDTGPLYEEVDKIRTEREQAE